MLDMAAQCTVPSPPPPSAFVAGKMYILIEWNAVKGRKLRAVT